MLDTYTIGSVRRISPEAPVTVLNVEREERRPGGAGNVALNLAALGGEVVCIGRVGDDSAGSILKEFLDGEGIDVTTMMVHPRFQTPMKNRIIAENQQIVRVDFEKVTPLVYEIEECVLSAIKDSLAKVDIVAISDYGKGFLTPTLLQSLIALAHKARIPVVVDPKGCDYSRYRGATVIKPNMKEAYEAAGMTVDSSLDDVAAKIIADTGIEHLLITRSKEGISLFEKDRGHRQFPIVGRDVIDVTGAGDTVLAMVTCALAHSLDMDATIRLANIAAGVAVERFGCAHVTLSDIAERLLEENISNKIFEEEHLYALQGILCNKQFVIIALDASRGLTSVIFQSIKRYGRSAHRELVIYIRDTDPDNEFIEIISSLSEVGFLVIKSESLLNLCNTIRPQHTFVIEDDTLIALDDAAALV